MLLSNAGAAMPHALRAARTELLFANSSSSSMLRLDKLKSVNIWTSTQWHTIFPFLSVARKYISLNSPLSGQQWNIENSRESFPHQWHIHDPQCCVFDVAIDSLSLSLRAPIKYRRILSHTIDRWSSGEKFLVHATHTQHRRTHMGDWINFEFRWLLRLLIEIYWIEKVISIFGATVAACLSSCGAERINWI